jgi:hypothetical protein
MNTTFDDANTSRDPSRLSDESLQAQHVRQRCRCEARLGLSSAEIEKMVADFVASHGSVTRCPTAYAMPSRQYRLTRHA